MPQAEEHNYNGKCPTCGQRSLTFGEADIEELLEFFDNGKERFNTDPTLNLIIKLIIQGENPYKIINRLLPPTKGAILVESMMYLQQMNPKQ